MTKIGIINGGMELVKRGKNIYMAMIHIAISPDNRNAC